MACSDIDKVEVKLSGEGNVKVRLTDGRDGSTMQVRVLVNEPVEVVAAAVI